MYQILKFRTVKHAKQSFIRRMARSFGYSLVTKQPEDKHPERERATLDIIPSILRIAEQL